MALDGISSMKGLTKNEAFDSRLTKPFIRHQILEENFPGKQFINFLTGGMPRSFLVNISPI
jgi:hypothetical protein